MNPYLQFVTNIRKGVAEAETCFVSGTTPTLSSPRKVLLFMPHPDDESIIGLLPLRLMRELGMQIIDIPVTFGSKVDRRQERANELADACGYLGWEVHKQQEGFQAMQVPDVVSVLNCFKPEILFMPHARDWNSRHISTHHLVVEALGEMGDGFSCKVVETEYWGAMDDPNLMVEGDAETVADLVAATSLHTGEVARNPYHLRLPAWMQDNVRRGGELVGGQGEADPGFAFATLYRLRGWSHGGWREVLESGRSVAAGETALKELF